MPEVSGVQSVLNSAKRAAASRDWGSAEKCFRLALRMQEVALGPTHPELARTLGHLAAVCEVSNQLGEAENCYRKAWAIAAAVLAPTDPVVTTSRDNLRQFCAAHNIPLDP
jgi:hypothetical protein